MTQKTEKFENQATFFHPKGRNSAFFGDLRQSETNNA